MVCMLYVVVAVVEIVVVAVVAVVVFAGWVRNCTKDNRMGLG